MVIVLDSRLLLKSTIFISYWIPMKNTRKIRREKNREKLNKQARIWRQENKEKVRAIKKRHYEKNKDKILASQREYMKKRRKKNPEKCRLYAQKWKSKNANHVSTYRESYYLSSIKKLSCHDHPSNQEIKVQPMNVYSPNDTEHFDFSIAWLLDLSRNAQMTSE